ncbi:hypothetical protein PCL_08511 [Purpureocillium lilacinum]|uniref:Uncharacterized protein n=1 Tax=Purpureocillium lilacinum TaxID=33203 RepID=A0A2U3DRK2_PURLI|nr:hypothetical protein Purlil1_5459 [Purpureocillium lilacinum]PWI64878.1 hypothetical protein PCL_08511 [Purpureocillium lilacinum]
MPGEGQQQLPGKPGAAGLAESRGEWSESQAGLAGHGAPGQAPQRIRASHRDLRRRERRVLPACSWCGVHLEADGAPRRPINASHAPPPNGQSATCLRHHREVGSTPRRGVSVDDQVVRPALNHQGHPSQHKSASETNADAMQHARQVLLPDLCPRHVPD